MFGQNLLGMGGLVPSSGHYTMGGYSVDTWRPSGGAGGASNGNAKKVNQTPPFVPSGMYQDPFGTAMSGTQTGTLQPYVNRMNQNASNALYGGLLGYSPQSMVAGDAGGTPQNSTVPQFNMPSALQGFNGFGNRSWMGGK